MSQKTRQEPVEENTVIKDGIEYEEVSTDDKVIGRAIRVSLAILVLLAAIGGASYWWLNRPKAVAPPQVAQEIVMRELAQNA